MVENIRALRFWAVTGWVVAALLGVALLLRRAPDEEREERAVPAPTTTTTTSIAEEIEDAGEAETRSEASLPEARVEPADGARIAAPVQAHVRQATAFVAQGDYEEAIRAYDKALELDPENAEIAILRAHAVTLQAWTTARRPDLAPAREIQETATVFVPAPDRSGILRSESGNSTRPPPRPADLIIELRPVNAEPADPYEFRIRCYNTENRALGVKSIEVISTYGGKSSGRGQKLQPLVSVVQAKQVAVLLESRGTWSEQQRRGTIEAKVTLVGDAQLSKKIWW